MSTFFFFFFIANCPFFFRTKQNPASAQADVPPVHPGSTPVESLLHPHLILCPPRQCAAALPQWEIWGSVKSLIKVTLGRREFYLNRPMWAEVVCTALAYHGVPPGPVPMGLEGFQCDMLVQLPPRKRVPALPGTGPSSVVQA